MPRSNRELYLAFGAILGITLLYAGVVSFTRNIPAASDGFGHGLGIIGLVLMLMTETLYSLRKRTRSARWGRMSSWLQFHIFTGLVGPYLVLLHTAWKFNGLAGALTLLTLLIVTSGFIGRYIYTAVPRSVDGAELAAGELQAQMQAAEGDLRRLLESQPETARQLGGMLALSQAAPGAGALLGRTFEDWQYRWQWWQARRRLPAAAQAQAAQLEGLQRRRRELARQLASLALARRMLSLWHSIHMPVGVALFATAFIHVAAALYYTLYLR